MQISCWYIYATVFPIIWLREINIYLVISEFISGLKYLLGSNKDSVRFSSVYFLHYVKNISMGRNLVSSIQLQPFPVLTHTSNGVSQNKGEKQWW
jgi:hypothetical protein